MKLKNLCKILPLRISGVGTGIWLVCLSKFQLDCLSCFLPVVKAFWVVIITTTVNMNKEDWFYRLLKWLKAKRNKRIQQTQSKPVTKSEVSQFLIKNFPIVKEEVGLWHYSLLLKWEWVFWHTSFSCIRNILFLVKYNINSKLITKSCFSNYSL